MNSLIPFITTRNKDFVYVEREHNENTLFSGRIFLRINLNVKLMANVSMRFAKILNHNIHK